MCLSPCVFQANGLVENKMIGCAVLVDGEITDSLELEMVEWLDIGEIFLHLAHRTDFQRGRIHHFLHRFEWREAVVLQTCEFVARIFNLPKTVVHTHFGF